MIGKLQGKINSCFEDHIIIDVGGVGYLVFVSAKTIHNANAGDACSLFIETYIREDKFHLYGFSSINEKLYFNLLQSVSGVGPRMSLSILSYFNPDQIQKIIHSKDKGSLCGISGVGPRLADKIILELQNRLPSVVYSQNEKTTNHSSDAIATLVALGINSYDAHSLISSALSQNASLSTEELIKIALKKK